MLRSPRKEVVIAHEATDPVGEVRHAVACFARGLQVAKDSSSGTHVGYQVRGLHTHESIEFIATYTAGCTLPLTSTTLESAPTFLPQDSAGWDLIRQGLEAQIGVDNTISEVEKTTRRNPWLMESICRFITHSADEAAVDAGFSESLLALSPLTFSVTRQGLDVISLLLRRDELIIGVAEVKATADNINGNISACYDELRQVSSPKRSYELRTRIHGFANGLGDAELAMLPRALYDGPRALLPYVGHGSADAFDFARSREAMRATLGVDASDLRYVLVDLNDFNDFFDRLAESTRDVLRRWST